MLQVPVQRNAIMPDPVRLERYKRLPELGPEVLFFSGGTAIKTLSQALTAYTKNSIHLLTPFDSGGSSAKLRQAFNMPAVGDIRSRLMALADQSITGNPEVYALADHRLDYNGEPEVLKSVLDSMIAGQHERVRAIPNPLQRLIRLQLKFFKQAMPEGFDLRGASVGNLILTGGYLNYQNHLDPILYLFSKLLAVQGQVQPVTDAAHHLAVELENGETILGQHLFTGKEHALISSPIKDIWLSACFRENRPVDVAISEKVSNYIERADLLCYPPGSFFSSLIANLLPKGVGEAVVKNMAPKVYVPNLGNDPEQIGMTLADSVSVLVEFLRRSADRPPLPAQAQHNQLVTHVLVDGNAQHYGLSDDDIRALQNRLQSLGINLIQTKLVTPESAPYYHPELLSQALLSLC